MLDTLNEKGIHQQCFNHLLTEVHNFLSDCSTDVIGDIFHLRQNTEEYSETSRKSQLECFAEV